MLPRCGARTAAEIARFNQPADVWMGFAVQAVPLPQTGFEIR